MFVDDLKRKWHYKIFTSVFLAKNINTLLFELLKTNLKLSI